MIMLESMSILNYILSQIWKSDVIFFVPLVAFLKNFSMT
jgi:hypothetical protein